jgi:hypothetical protein
MARSKEELMLRAVVVLLALALFAGPVRAQKNPGPWPGPLPGPGSGINTPPDEVANPALTRRERIKKRIRALRAYTLTEELALDETTAGKLFPVLARYDDALDKLLQQRADLARRLDAAGDLKDARELDTLIDDALANQRGFWDVEAKRIAELRKILTPQQTARLLVVLPALERKIQNQLQRAILGGGGGGKKARKNDGPKDDPFDDRDDDVEPGDDRPFQPKKRSPKVTTPPPAPSKSDPRCDPFTDMHACNR